MERIRAQKNHFAAGLITVGILLMVIAVIFAIRVMQPQSTKWQLQSIDTMKYSRDLAREKRSDESFINEIESQVESIANTGATHVSIATPYDDEFIPFLKKWVISARRNGLKIWFRGNFSGWEEWFGYEKITRAQHIKMVENFILANEGLFEDGDFFSPCPECENGGPGDPRITHDIEGYRAFLVDEHTVAQKAFNKIGKNVASNLASMNYDVATLIMDEKTTLALDGVVTIDHYVESPEKLNADITEIARKSKGKVVLGEFGVPIPDIHGRMSEVEQSEWLRETLHLLHENEHLMGLNYWVGKGGSTHLWNDDGSARAAVDVLKKSYKLE